MKVRVKYCGGCNPRYDRKAEVARLRAAFPDIEFAETGDEGPFDHVVVICGCSAAFGAAPHELAGAALIDVRRAGVFEQAEALIAGAQWRDPQDVGSWAAELPEDKAVAVYCAHGHEVSRATALRLRAAGIDARFLRGGFDGWKAAGRPLQPKGEQR